MRKTIAAVVAALTVTGAVSSGSASAQQPYYHRISHHGPVVAAGLMGAALSSTLADSSRGRFANGYYYGPPAYAYDYYYGPGYARYYYSPGSYYYWLR